MKSKIILNILVMALGFIKDKEVLYKTVSQEEWFNESIYKYGLCALVDDMQDSGKISYEEMRLVEKYFNSNRPSDSKHYRGTGFWFKPGNWGARNKWLERHIIKLGKTQEGVIVKD